MTLLQFPPASYVAGTHIILTSLRVIFCLFSFGNGVVFCFSLGILKFWEMCKGVSYFQVSHFVTRGPFPCIFLQIWEIFFHYVLIISFMPLSVPVSSDSKCLFTFLLICCSSDFSHNTLVLCLVMLCLRVISTPVYFVKSLPGCWSLFIELCALLDIHWFSNVWWFLILGSCLCLKTPNSAVCGSRLWSHGLGRGGSVLLAGCAVGMGPLHREGLSVPPRDFLLPGALPVSWTLTL